MLELPQIGNMKNRLIRNYLTTVMGIAIWAYTAYLLNKGMDTGQSISEASSALWPYMGLGTLLLRSKDSLIGLPKSETKSNESK